MKKIPTLFVRDWAGNPSRVVNQVHEGCEWVLAGEGVATRKYDGTCCMIREGKLYKRREIRRGEPTPLDFETADYDDETGKTVGWVPVGDGPEDRWHREAMGDNKYPDGTYELLGPKVQGNPEGFAFHILQPHAAAWKFIDAPRDFANLRNWFLTKNIEGIVFHHLDGRMAKIKLRDFGLRRVSQP